MGAEREDTDPGIAKLGTDPGLGPPSAPRGAARPAPPPPLPARRVNNGAAPPLAAPAAGPVDFDALHAALGPPSRDPDETLEMPPVAPRVGTARPEIERSPESHGQSSASYASAAPRALPQAYTPTEEPDIPAVIVKHDDTVPAAPPQMTVPMGTPAVGPGMVATPMPSPGPQPVGPTSSGHHHAAPSADPYAFATHTPQQFVVPRGPGQPTVRMAERPRRPRTPTVVVRRRGPSSLQKIVAFVAMLVLVTACGIAVIIWRQPAWVGLEATPESLVPASGPVAPTPVPMPPEPAEAITAPSATLAPPLTAAPPATHAPPAKAPKGKRRER
jgi:hypothetical protein